MSEQTETTPDATPEQIAEWFYTRGGGLPEGFKAILRGRPHSFTAEQLDALRKLPQPPPEAD